MSNDTIIQEVGEELRRDRMRMLWRQGGPYVIGAAVLIVLVVAGYEGWTWWQKTQAAKSSDQFYAAMQVADGTDFAGAKKALDDVIAQTSGGYPMLGQFREAALLSQQGKADDAVAAYDALSTALPNTHLRELALILAGNALIDKGDVAAVQQRVGGSIIPGDPLRNAAREVLGLTQYKAGKLDDAMKSFTDILNDPLTTTDDRNRIQIYTLQLLAEGAKPIAPPSDQTTLSSVSSVEVSSAPPPATSSAVSSASASVETSAASSAPVESSQPTSASLEASSAPVTASSTPAPAISSDVSSVSAVSSEASSAPAVASQVSSAASTAVDESTDLDVTPPVNDIDTSMLTLAVPQDATSASASTDALSLTSDTPAAPSLPSTADQSSAPATSVAPDISSSAP